PQLRVTHPNSGCLSKESRAAGTHFVSRTNTQIRSGQQDSTIRASRKQSRPAAMRARGWRKQMQQAWLKARGASEEPEFVAFVGIDWGDEEHVWCWQAGGEKKRESGKLASQAGAVEAWVGELRQRFGFGPIAIAIEQTRQALVWQLSKHQQLYLYVVAPQTSAQFRKTFYPSGAKDDPRDADLLLDLVLQHRDRLRCFAPDTEQTRLLQNLVEERRKLVDEKTAIVNTLTARLKLYFPQILEWLDRL